MVTGVMNCSAASVITTWTVAPALIKVRHNSADFVAGNATGKPKNNVFSIKIIHGPQCSRAESLPPVK